MPRASELLQAVAVYVRALHARDFELLDSVIVDQLSFVDGPDGWRIVAKVWHLESTIEPRDSGRNT